MDHHSEAKAWRLIAILVSIFFWGMVLFAFQVNAAEAGKPGTAKTLSGISIVGNNEAPKSLFIVPWKSSEIGSDSGFNSGLLDDSMRPVDREVFMREVEFYQISNTTR